MDGRGRGGDDVLQQQQTVARHHLRTRGQQPPIN